MPDDFVIIDCNKTRTAAAEWKRKLGNDRWKKLGIKSNQLQRITGTAKGEFAEFSRVRLDHMTIFAEKCGYPVEYFRADADAFMKWKHDRRQCIPRTHVSCEPAAAQTDHSAESGTGRTPESVRTDNDLMPQPIGARDALIALHKRLSGYYEVYHYATSKYRGRAISIFLLHVSRISHTECAIECEIHDRNFVRPYFHNRGRIISLGGFLYWEFRTDQQDAIIHCCSYAPTGEKYPGFTLYGLFLTTGGGNTREYPVAAKAALRYLGETADEAANNSIVDLRNANGTSEERLHREVGGYLADLKKGKFLRSDLLETIKSTILPNISNHVSTGTVPFVLRMPRVG